MSNVFSFATSEDGAGILKIMESDIARGEIRLLYTRRPNPYNSFMKESDKSVVGIFKRDGEIVGTIAGIPRNFYVAGDEHNACYVTNMKRLHDLKSRIHSAGSCVAEVSAWRMCYDKIPRSEYHLTDPPRCSKSAIPIQ